MAAKPATQTVLLTITRNAQRTARLPLGGVLKLSEAAVMPVGDLSDALASGCFPTSSGRDGGVGQITSKPEGEMLGAWASKVIVRLATIRKSLSNSVTYRFLRA